MGGRWVFAISCLILSISAFAKVGRKNDSPAKREVTSDNNFVQRPFKDKKEIERFCLETWFPKLRIGHKPDEAELQASLTGLLEMYTDDIEFVDPNNLDHFGMPVLKGKDLVGKYYRSILANYHSWEFKILELHPTDKGFVLRYEGRNAPPVDSFEGVDIIEVVKTPNGIKISKLIGYYDRKPFMPRQ